MLRKAPFFVSTKYGIAADTLRYMLLMFTATILSKSSWDTSMLGYLLYVVSALLTTISSFPNFCFASSRPYSQSLCFCNIKLDEMRFVGIAFNCNVGGNSFSVGDSNICYQHYCSLRGICTCNCFAAPAHHVLIWSHGLHRLCRLLAHPK